MVMTDPIADFLTRIRNANQVKHEVLEVPASNIKKGLQKSLSVKALSKTLKLLKMASKGSFAYFLNTVKMVNVSSLT